MRGLMEKKRDIFSPSKAFKPFEYPEAYEIWLEHEQMHWVSREVKLHEDVKDWKTKVTPSEQEFLNNIFLLFTQSDIDVAAGYVKDYLPFFEKPELRMMLLGFASREAVHIDAYSYLLETLGKPDSFYSGFNDIPVMKEKHKFFEKIIAQGNNKKLLPLKIAGISAFTEGMFLFSSFVMLLSFPRTGLMKGMGQIVSWSILDEQKHVEGLMYIFKKIIQENRGLWNNALKSEIYSTAEMMFELESDFTDYVFAGKDEFRGLTRESLALYQKFIINKRLLQMGLKAIYKDALDNPLPWVDEVVNSQSHGNFFETRDLSYSKGTSQGDWGDIWGKVKV